MEVRTGLNWFQAAMTSIGGFLGWYLGGLDSFLYALIAFVAVDYLTGVMAAIQDKKLSGKVGAHGIFKKVMIFLLVGVAHMVDSQIIGHDNVIRTAVVFFYLSNEGISIMENAAHLGLPIPQKLRAILESLHEAKEQDKMAAVKSDGTPIDAAVVKTVKVAVRETMMETASELGVFPPLRRRVIETDIPTPAPIVDADPNTDLTGGDDQ
jgi:toxin secretion/phage lysis holin